MGAEAGAVCFGAGLSWGVAGDVEGVVAGDVVSGGLLVGEVVGSSGDTSSGRFWTDFHAVRKARTKVWMVFESTGLSLSVEPRGGTWQKATAVWGLMRRRRVSRE